MASDDVDKLIDLRLHTLGGHIREERLKQGMTQDELAVRAGVGRSGLADLEGGGRNLTMRTLWRITDALGLHVADLLDDRTS